MSLLAEGLRPDINPFSNLFAKLQSIFSDINPVDTTPLDLSPKILEALKLKLDELHQLLRSSEKNESAFQLFISELKALALPEQQKEFLLNAVTAAWETFPDGQSLGKRLRARLTGASASHNLALRDLDHLLSQFDGRYKMLFGCFGPKSPDSFLGTKQGRLPEASELESLELPTSLPPEIPPPQKNETPDEYEERTKTEREQVEKYNLQVKKLHWLWQRARDWAAGENKRSDNFQKRMKEASDVWGKIHVSVTVNDNAFIAAFSTSLYDGLSDSDKIANELEQSVEAGCKVLELEVLDMGRFEFDLARFDLLVFLSGDEDKQNITNPIEHMKGKLRLLKIVVQANAILGSENRNNALKIKEAKIKEADVYERVIQERVRQLNECFEIYLRSDGGRYFQSRGDALAGLTASGTSFLEQKRDTIPKLPFPDRESRGRLVMANLACLLSRDKVVDYIVPVRHILNDIEKGQALVKNLDF